MRSPAWSAHSTGAHEGLQFLLGKILTPPTPRVLGTAESGEGVGWESRRERIGPAERETPLWILQCGSGWGVESKSRPLVEGWLSGCAPWAMGGGCVGLLEVILGC